MALVGGQLLLIAWGLWQLRVSSQERNRQLDAMEAAQRRQGDALERQGEVLAELLRRSCIPLDPPAETPVKPG